MSKRRSVVQMVASFVLLMVTATTPWWSTPWVRSLDATATQAVLQYRAPWRDQFCLYWTATGSRWAVLAATLSLGLWLGWRHRHRISVYFVLFVLGGALVNVSIKHWVQRLRPPALLALYEPHGFSFPSGHSSAAMCFFLGVLHVQARGRLPQHAALVWPLWAWALSIGVSRVWLGVHYASDVLAAWVVCAAWYGMFWSALDVAQWNVDGGRRLSG